MAGVRLKGNLTAQIEIAWNGSSYVDETARCKRFTISRGYTEDQSSIQGGMCSLVFADTVGRYNPTNTGSAIYPEISYPRRPVRVRVTYASTTYYLFAGYTTRHESDPARDAREARIDCMDAFVLLGGDGGIKPTIASSTTTTGAAIGAILTAAGFGGSTSLDTGDVITFSADGSATGLDLISGMLVTERGFFFMAKDGTATYLDRAWPYTSPYNTSQGTIASTMRAVLPVADLALIRNRATVTRTGGTAQTASDATSISRYGTRDFQPITSSYLNTDSDALALAGYLVTTAKAPLPPVRAIEFGQHDTTVFTQMLTRELGDHVTVTESLGGTSGSYHIRSIAIEGDWSKGELSCRWGLRQRNTAFAPFIVGISNVGGTDLITY